MRQDLYFSAHFEMSQCDTSESFSGSFLKTKRKHYNCGEMEPKSALSADYAMVFRTATQIALDSPDSDVFAGL